VSAKRDSASTGRRDGGRRELRRLLACPRCRRQYDAGAAARGERLRCLCGELLVVPELVAAEVPVVRCAACGAPRPPGSSRCGYCRAPFAAVERDRNTICPHCAARIADAARFCSSCGTRIDPQPLAATPTGSACPACTPARPLRSRPFPDPPENVLECDGCGGLWLSRELWLTLERRARRDAVAAPEPTRAAPIAAAPVIYRDCPICAAKMHRRNYGGRSGVIVDLCGAHGLWFDADELERALDWVRRGGHEAAERLRCDEERSRERERRLYPPPPAEPPAGPADEARGPRDLAEVVDLLRELFQRALRRD
jgi:Zn-finger nucleic acid-binding protein